jgi:hypothetical protein
MAGAYTPPPRPPAAAPATALLSPETTFAWKEEPPTPSMMADWGEFGSPPIYGGTKSLRVGGHIDDVYGDEDFAPYGKAEQFADIFPIAQEWGDDIADLILKAYPQLLPEIVTPDPQLEPIPRTPLPPEYAREGWVGPGGDVPLDLPASVMEDPNQMAMSVLANRPDLMRRKK